MERDVHLRWSQDKIVTGHSAPGTVSLGLEHRLFKSQGPGRKYTPHTKWEIGRVFKRTH